MRGVPILFSSRTFCETRLTFRQSSKTWATFAVKLAVESIQRSERQGIVRSIDVAEYLGVTKASVSKAMATLESNGYVEMGKRDVHLTERGLEVARQMWERHCFFVGLLEDAGVSAEVASQEGCHMEHCLSEESFEKLRAMLGRDSDRDQ